MKKLSKIAPLIVICILMGACSGSEGVKQDVTPERVEEETTTDENSVSSVFKINEQIKLGDYIVSVTGIEDPYIESNKFSQPEDGNKFVAVEVLHENSTSDKTLDYNPFDWKLYDSEGYSFEQAFSSNKEPRLSSGTLNSGKKVKGWITFEVPTNSSNFTIQFIPSWLSNDNVEIELF